MHWKTVSMAKKMLSKLVMPPLGPSHLPLHSVPFSVQKRPLPAKAQGDASSSIMRPEAEEGKGTVNEPGPSWAPGRSRRITGGGGVAGFVHPPDEQLQTDDGVDDDDEHDQHANVQQGHHGLHDGVQHNLQT